MLVEIRKDAGNLGLREMADGKRMLWEEMGQEAWDSMGRSWEVESEKLMQGAEQYSMTLVWGLQEAAVGVKAGRQEGTDYKAEGVTLHSYRVRTN